MSLRPSSFSGRLRHRRGRPHPGRLERLKRRAPKVRPEKTRLPAQLHPHSPDLRNQRIVVKAEHNALGPNTRFVVTNLTTLTPRVVNIKGHSYRLKDHGFSKPLYPVRIPLIPATDSERSDAGRS